MRITVELDEKNLGDLLKVTGHKKSSPAVAFAVRDFINRKKSQRLWPDVAGRQV